MGIRPISGQELHKEIDMGKMTSRQRYIHNLAGTILAGNYIYPNHARELYQWYAGMVSEKLSKFTDHTLGKVAACGLSILGDAATENTTLYDVRGNAVLDWKGDGRHMMLEIAVATVIAAMMDIVRARAR